MCVHIYILGAARTEYCYSEGGTHKSGTHPCHTSLPRAAGTRIKQTIRHSLKRVLGSFLRTSCAGAQRRLFVEITVVSSFWNIPEISFCPPPGKSKCDNETCWASISKILRTPCNFLHRLFSSQPGFGFFRTSLEVKQFHYTQYKRSYVNHTNPWILALFQRHDKFAGHWL